MKRFAILSLVLVLCLGSMRSQVITITFEATLNGPLIPLDSILVMNLTQGGDTTIYFPNNVLVLGAIGLNEQVGVAPVLSVVPNPFETSTELHVVTVAMGDLMLKVHNASGREVASLLTPGVPGVHRFRFTAPSHGVYVMSVTQGGQRCTHRLVATEGSGNAVALRHLGAGALGGKAKSDRSAFLWEAGDALRYIGYATDAAMVNSAAIDEVPVVSATRTFTLNAGNVCPDSPTVIDIDGNVYPAVEIGDQCWMAANLKTSRYREGTTIPNVTDNSAWTQQNSGAWSNYSNSLANDTIYGKLYNWYAAANPNICPEGWHMPTDAEWASLSNNGVGGGQMKAISPLWYPPNAGATNSSGFSALPSGFRSQYNGDFMQLWAYGGWWSASESGGVGAWGRVVAFSNAGLGINDWEKGLGTCVRCVRD